MDYRTTLLLKEFVTHNVLRLIVERPKGFSFTPGQGVELAIDQEGWRGEGRPFTPTSLPGDGVVEFTIKVYPEHRGVTAELARLQPGSALLMSAPFGTISYHGPGTFIAGGAGITPFLSILRSLAEDDTLAENSLLYTNKRAEDIICEKELKSLLGERARFICSQDDDCRCHPGRVDKTFLQQSINDFSQRFYLCGPPQMVDSLGQALEELGAEPEAVVFER